MIRANIWLAITTMCGPAPITTLARSARPAWPSPCPGTPEKHSSAGGRLTSACSKHALNTDMENSPSLWHMPPQTLPKTTRRQTSMPFCSTLLAQDRRMTLLSFYLTLMHLSLETLELTGRMWLAPHSSTEPPTTIGLYRENAIAIESEARDPCIWW